MIGKEIGNYRIIDLVGKGGMAVVYKGQHKTLTRRIVAIKMLSAALEGDKSFHDRFFREAEVMDRLRHPNIVTLYDFIEYSGQYFIVMEYVDGTTLHHVIKESQGPLPLERINQIFGQTLSALDYAHKLGIVHRDIKPGNIMINKEGQVKITDFGIARILGENFETTITATGVGIGSPYYMSPEQVLASKKHPITAASDIYSLGITLYQMLTGRLPFSEGGSLYTIMQSHIKEAPPMPSQFRPGISPAIEKVVLKAIAKKPEDRWPSCEEFRVALEIALAQEAKSEEKLTEPIYEPPSAEETPPQPAPISSPRKKSALGPALLAAIIIVAMALGAGAYYFTKLRKTPPKHTAESVTQVARPENAKTSAEPEANVPQATSVAQLPSKPDQAPTPSQGEESEAQPTDFSRTLQQANEAFNAGQFDKAQILAQKVLQKQPGNKDAREIISKIEQQKKNKSIAAKLEKAEADLRAGKYNTAIISADEVLSQDPTNTKALDIKKRAQSAAKEQEQKRLAIEAKLAKAEAYLDAKRFRKAAKEAQSVLSMDSNNPKAKRILAEAMKRAKRAAIDAKIGEAQGYLNARKYGLALKTAQQILNRFPGEPRAIEIRKQALAGLKHTHSKEEIVARMVQRAEKLLETQQFHKARVLADKILDMDPDNKRAQDILELAMEGENRQIFQRFLGQGAAGPAEGGGESAPLEGGQEQPMTPPAPLPIPVLPGQ